MMLISFRVKAVLSMIIYVLGTGFTYAVLKERHMEDWKAYLIGLVWLPAIIIMMTVFTIKVIFPNIGKSVKQGFNKLKV